MEEGDWPVTIIKNDFLLSGITPTSSEFPITEQLGIRTSTTVCAVSCADSPVVENCPPFKLSSNSSLKDPFNSSVGSSDYFGSEGISPCSSSYFSPESSSESPELSNQLHNQNSHYHHIESNTCTTKLQFSFNRYKHKSSFEPGETGTTNLQMFQNVTDIDPIHSTVLELKTDESTATPNFATFSPPLYIGTPTGIISSSTPSPNFGSTQMQPGYYQYTSSLLHDSFFVPSTTNSLSANYYQHNTMAAENRQILSYKNYNANSNSPNERLANNEGKHEIVKNEVHINEVEGYRRFNTEKFNNILGPPNQKRNVQSLNETDQDQFYSNEIDSDGYNTENDDKQFYERSYTAVSPVCDSSTAEYCDELGSTLTETPEEELCSTSSSTSGSTSTRLKNREEILQEKMIPLPPTKTRSKMHDLAVKHRLITNQNTRAHGTIQLSAEEKRTLLQEGYRLPTHLPLSREEEEALKIVRRKIKNKLSAQESRRKRKEYIDNLEKKVHSFYNDNVQLRNRMKQLEVLNRDLLTQLKKMQQ